MASAGSKVVDLLVHIRRNNSTARHVTPLARSLFRPRLNHSTDMRRLYHYVGARSAANSAVFKFNNGCAKFTVLISPEDMDKAAKKAVDYRPPGR
jgi:hypothetical protein